MAQGWSSLLVDLVNCVADCLLATNDLDCYTALRAVCHHWRSSTADPRSNQHDPRFRPSRWVMLDEPEIVSSIITDGTSLFVNTATGRFLHRRLPLHHDSEYVLVTSTTSGLIVVAAREPLHAVSVLNPFTGCWIHFAAPLPSQPGWLSPRLTADVVGSSPTLVLVSVGCNRVCWAEPQSERFSDLVHPECPASRLPLIAASVNNESHASSSWTMDMDMLMLLWSEYEHKASHRRYAVVTTGGDMLAVSKWRRGMDVFKIDSAGNVVERVKSIGSQALFLGVRCLAVDTDCFPTVEPNCAYFELTGPGMDQPCYIYKVNIGILDDEQEPELVSAAVYTDDLRPLTLTHLLSNYTMDIPRQPLTWTMCSNYNGPDHYDDYIDGVCDESDEDYEYYSDLDYDDYYEYL